MKRTMHPARRAAPALTGTVCAAALMCAALGSAWTAGAAETRTHRAAPDAARPVIDLPFVPAAGGALRGYVRLANPGAAEARVEIYGFDETGARFGPVSATLPAGATRELDAAHLEGRRAHRALDGALGDGHGHWRLRLRSAGDLEARAYAWTGTRAAGAPVHLRALALEGSAPAAYLVPVLDPRTDAGTVAYLRIGNPSAEANTVTLRAWDDEGRAGARAATLAVPARATVTVSAQTLEREAWGDGTGKWRVRVESADARALFVVALVRTPDGAVHNVSQ